MEIGNSLEEKIYDSLENSITEPVYDSSGKLVSPPLDTSVVVSVWGIVADSVRRQVRKSVNPMSW